MCRNIKTLFNFDPPATELEIRDASLQFVRKLSGFNLPSQANQAAFDRAVEDIAASARSARRFAGHFRRSAQPGSPGQQGTRKVGGALRPCRSLGPAVKVALDELPNLGPKSRAMLASAGITTLPHLRTLGAVAAYARVKRSGANASLNLLWALEGALTGLPWQVVARDHRTSLLLALEQHERGDAHSSIPPDARRPHP